MPLIKKSDLSKYTIKSMFESVSMESVKDEDSFDIFLSHSYKDKDYASKLRYMLMENGFSVYIDWMDDAQLSRSQVSEETADILRKRMKQSQCLVFATSDDSINSKWMPWECGYFDGFNGKVAILPLVDQEQWVYEGQEYLGLYPYISESFGTLQVSADNNSKQNFKDWINDRT